MNLKYAITGKIRVFLTLRCNYDCPYCTNQLFDVAKYGELRPERWVDIFNTFYCEKILLTGGEPGIYKGLKQVMEGCPSKAFVVITNGSEKSCETFKTIKTKNFGLNVSYHPLFDDWPKLQERIIALGIPYQFHCVGTKTNKLANIDNVPMTDYIDKDHCTVSNKACSQEKKAHCWCYVGEINIAPDGQLFHCRSKLLRKADSLGKLHLNPEAILRSKQILECHEYGWCLPCEEHMRTWEKL